MKKINKSLFLSAILFLFCMLTAIQANAQKKKLMGGNQRFIEGKSIHPRQDSLVIRSLEADQKPSFTQSGYYNQ